MHVNLVCCYCLAVTYEQAEQRADVELVLVAKIDLDHLVRILQEIRAVLKVVNTGHSIVGNDYLLGDLCYLVAFQLDVAVMRVRGVESNNRGVNGVGLFDEVIEVEEYKLVAVGNEQRVVVDVLAGLKNGADGPLGSVVEFDYLAVYFLV